jgi:hypothetical protein
MCIIKLAPLFNNKVSILAIITHLNCTTYKQLRKDQHFIAIPISVKWGGSLSLQNLLFRLIPLEQRIFFLVIVKKINKQINN